MFAICSTDDIQQEFARLANLLLNGVDLMVNIESATIVEIEFYYKTPDHPDPFIHCDEWQRTTDCWYFHRQNGGKYRNGSFKGLDLTCSPVPNHEGVYAGILIRSIVTQRNELIEGPCNVVNWLLKHTDCKEITEMVEQMQGKPYQYKHPFGYEDNDNVKEYNAQNDNCELGKKPPSAIDNTHCIYLEPRARDEYRTARIFAGARHGLSLARAAEGSSHLEYLTKPYRFSTLPNQLKNGRGQFGIIRYIELLNDATMSRDERCQILMREFAVKNYIVQNWIQAFDEGCAENDVKCFYVKPVCKMQTIVQICRVHGYTWKHPSINPAHK